MSNRRCLVSLLTLALPLALAPVAAQATDIGYVDMQQVIEKSKVGAKVQEQLRKDFEPKAKPIGAEEQSIREAQKSLAKEAALMSKDQVEKRQAEIKKRIEAFEKAAAPFQQELLKAQKERGREVLEPAQKAVDVVAKQKKLGMIVERSQAGVVYLDKSLDITDEVIKQMDANTK